MSKYIWLFLIMCGGYSTNSVAQMELRPPSSGNYRSVHGVLPLPLPLEQTMGRVEFNLGGKASLAIEGAYSHPDERYHDKDVELTGESLYAYGRGVSLILARFTEPATMSGFYWGLGFGFREMRAQWKANADPGDPNINFGLVDTEGYLHHDAKLSGMTGHGRLGYRYVPDWPLMMGVFMGARHFQSKVEDTTDDHGDTVATPMTEKEKQRLKRYFMSKLEPGIELAISF